MEKQKRFFYFCARSLIVLGFLFLLAQTWVGQSFLAHNGLNDADSSYFLYGGRVIEQGQHLYHDFWDQKPPAIFFQNALLLYFFAANFSSWAICHGLVLLGFYVFLWKSFYRHTQSFLWTSLAVFCFGSAFNLNNYQDYGNRPEFAMSLLDLASVWIFLRAWQSPTFKGFLFFLAGLCGALAFFYKPVGMAGLLSAGALSVLWHRDNLKTGRQLLSLFGGALLGALFFAALGMCFGFSFKDILDAAILVPLELSTSGGLSYGDAFLAYLLALGPLWGFLSGILFCVAGCVLKNPYQKICQLLVLHVLAVSAGILLQKKGHPHYYLQAVGPVVLCGMWGFFVFYKKALFKTPVLDELKKSKNGDRVGQTFLKDHFFTRSLFLPKFLLSLFFLLGVLVFARYALVRQWREYKNLAHYQASYQVYVELDDWFKNHLKEGDSFYYWSHGYTPYNLRGVFAPCVYPPQLFHMGKGGAALIKKDLDCLAKTPPRFLLENKEVYKKAFNEGTSLFEQGLERSVFVQYQSWKKKDYTFLASVGNTFLVYERR